MRGLKPPGVPPAGRPSGPESPNNPRSAPRAPGAALRAGRGPTTAPKSPARALGRPPPRDLDAADLVPKVVDAEAEEQVAFLRKHAADLEEESRRHVSGETAAELARQEEADLARRVAGFHFDERRKKRGRRPPDPDDDEREEAEEDEDAEGRAKALIGASVRGAAFGSEPEDRLGDETLVDPNEMKRVLGASARFAQHAMILAERRREAGLSRAETIAFLAGLYQRLDDRAYAERALRAFGPGTGILDVYPLEVVEHLLTHVPAFFGKTRRAPLFGGRLSARARPGGDILLTYDAGLRIRGFALEGGPRPGYRFEPIDPPGRYRLVIESPGRFEVLVSAITRDGWVLLDSLDVEVRPDGPDPSEVTVTPSDAPPSPASPPGPGRPDRPERRGAGPSDLPDDLSQIDFPRRI